MGGGTPVDLVVVGAGAAGLAAAKTARERGLGVVLLEAGDRIGGRAHTDHATFGFPWDRGCHWLHSASINPLRDIADALGFRYQRQPTSWRSRLDGRWATEAEQHEQETGYDRAHEAAAAAGAAGQDVPVASVVDLGGPGGELYRLAVHAEWGMAPEEVSTRDLVAYRDTDEDWPVEDGYGALVARLNADVPVELRTPAERIEWAGPGVRVTTPRGTIEAGAVVVTVSTNALAADLIRFDPALPDWKQAAAEAVPLGRANKIAFAIEGRRLGVSEPTSIDVPVAGRGRMSFRLRPFGRDLADGYLAGPLCKELEEIGEDAMIETALAALRDALGADATRHVAATACTRWGAEPWILGAYAAARPGHAHRRADLARPLADRIFFAGEATSPDFFSTCHGAHLSGIAAAHAVAATLTHRVHGPRVFPTAAPA